MNSKNTSIILLFLLPVFIFAQEIIIKDINFEEVKKRMKTPNIIDGRNLYDPKILREYGFNYIGVGR